MSKGIGGRVEVRKYGGLEERKKERVEEVVGGGGKEERKNGVRTNERLCGVTVQHVECTWGGRVDRQRLVPAREVGALCPGEHYAEYIESGWSFFNSYGGRDPALCR
jgi:hypothetical protein